MLKTLFAVTLLATWASAVVILAFARQWTNVSLLLAAGVLVENIAHYAIEED